MLNSSDSEIIQRKKPMAKKRQHYNDESSLSEVAEDSGVIEGSFEPLFYELFGNGDEYAYIYDPVPAESSDVQEPSPLEIKPAECYSYVSKILYGFGQLFRGFSYEIMKELIEGYSVEYLAFYRNRMTVKELYFVKDLMEEFKVFTISAKNNRADCLRSLRLPRGEERPLEIPGLLNISEYVENLLSFERKHIPRGSLDMPCHIDLRESEGGRYGWGEGKAAPLLLSESSQESIREHFRRAINQIASNPTFIDRVYRCHETAILEGCDDGLGASNSLSCLQRLYQLDSDDIHDEVRKYIIQAAYESVSVDANEIRKRFAMGGMLNGEGSLQELVDLIISLRGKPGSVAGVFYDRSLFSVVKIDGFGNVVSTEVFKEHESAELRSFLSGIDIICITSTSSNIKHVLQSYGLNFLYVPKRLSFFKDLKELSVPYNIALAVQNPVLYFSRALYCLQNNYPIHNLQYTDSKMIGRAIAIACATHKLDWCTTLSHRFGHTLLRVLGISLAEKYFDYDHLQTLGHLREVFSTMQFSNICTYFNLLSSRNPLDRTLVHPDLHSIAIILCKGAYHRLLNDRNEAVLGGIRYDINKDQDKILELMVSKPSLVESFVVPADGDDAEEMASLSNVRRIFINSNEICFSGASDAQIFEDVVPHLNNQVYLGTVCKIGTDFVLCLVSDAIVYAKKTFDCTLNQIVKVEITGSTPSMLSYSGNIQETAAQPADRFKTHTLFRNMDEPSIENYMNAKAHSILIRPSSTENHCVVVCKIQDDLFYNLKLRECCKGCGEIEPCYDFKGRMFTSIDEFIEDYVKKIYRTVREAMRFKHFFKSPSEAREYLSVPGEYVKYCLYLSREYPGYLECLFGNKRILVKIDGDSLVCKGTRLPCIDELVRFIKTNARDL